jgi:endonuclease/exonuclease/phosphatase family metal-dependent hydrolase
MRSPRRLRARVRRTAALAVLLAASISAPAQAAHRTEPYAVPGAGRFLGSAVPVAKRPAAKGPALSVANRSALSVAKRPAVRVAKRPAATVSVMSFNMCGGACHRGEVTATGGYTAGAALSRGAQVVLLQEVCYSQFLKVSSVLKPHGYTALFARTTTSGVCDDHDRKHGTGFGVALLVRGRATGHVVRYLPSAVAEHRVLLGATATLGGRSTFVAVVHLAPSAAAGLDLDLAAVAAYLDPMGRRPVIVGGDFNALPDNPGLDGLYSRRVGGWGNFVELDETRTGVARRGGAATFDTAGRKIDYVFLSDGLFGSLHARSAATSMSDHHIYSGTARVTP